jgi:heat-inducible transcriptional repressor
MPDAEHLTDRQLRVLAAVIETYIETAEPAGSRVVAARSGMGISSATIRNTMSDLEKKGYLFHPHTSAGRIPTDRAYRAYVDLLMRLAPPSTAEREALSQELPGSRGGSAVEEVLRRAAQVLGVLTQELGVGVAPALDEIVLERLELVRVTSERLLLVFNLRSGVVRTIFVQIPGAIAPDVVHRVSHVLNERLAGLTLQEIRTSLAQRLRDAGHTMEGRELLNIFIREGEEIFDLSSGEADIVMGSAQMLADQPEFASNQRMRDLLELTERRDLLQEALRARRRTGLSITIGGENVDPRLNDFTLVTASYERGGLSGVIGVLGPTRMPYDKIIGLVEHTSRLIEGLLT